MAAVRIGSARTGSDSGAILQVVQFNANTGSWGAVRGVEYMGAQARHTPSVASLPEDGKRSLQPW